jgi:pimeloyl-ACP methyl ester carboxylesterase
MQIVGLPGRQPETESWLRSVLSAAMLPAEGMVRYRHWDEDVDASAGFEAERLCGLTPALVVAKSFGTAIAAAAFGLHQFRPRAAVLIGTPYQQFCPGAADLSGTPYDAVAGTALALLRQLAQGVETLFIQQVQDPGGSSGELARTLQLSGGQVEAVPGSDHMYLDVAALAAIIRRWSHGRFDQPD